MSYYNYLDEDYSGDDSDRDQRRGREEIYDAISDPAALRNAMDPISEQDKLDKAKDVIQTPIPPLFNDRETNVSTGTIPYNGQAQQTSQATSVQSRQVHQNAPATPVDKFLAICTAFLATIQSGRNVAFTLSKYTTN